MTQPPDTCCQALAADGSPCANPPLAGSAFCALHSGPQTADFDSDSDGWLAVDDRAAIQPAPTVLPVTALRPADSVEPAPLGDDLWIDDRLTGQRVRDVERQSRLQGELAKRGVVDVLRFIVQVQQRALSQPPSTPPPSAAVADSRTGLMMIIT